MTTLLDELSTQCQRRLEHLFQIYLNRPVYLSKKLQQAMAYAVENGGKRIRPLLVYITGRMLNTSWENLDAPACAIELIHSYSLIHDDLPAMDNSDLRRGKPTCHIAFDEATAILAGDALQPLAFEILATHPSDLSAQQRLDMIQVLSHASGIQGMATGQVLDLSGVDSLEALTQMYQLKTSALLISGVKLGIIASNIEETSICSALEKYIENVSLAFQIQDDLLDIQGDPSTMGKPQGLDHTNMKITYPDILGIENTQNTVHTLFQSALQAIQPLGEKGIALHDLAHYLMRRKK